MWEDLLGFEQFQNLINKPKHQSRIKPGTKEKLLRVETGKTGTTEEMKKPGSDETWELS